MTIKTKHETLDQAILNKISIGPVRFIDLLGLPEVGETALHSARNKDNVLNGRLQILRKRRKIEFSAGYWRLVRPLFAESDA